MTILTTSINGASRINGAFPAVFPSDRTPPHDLDAERSFLGAVMLAPALLADPACQLETGDFYAESHARIHAAVLRLTPRSRMIDAVMVAELLGGRDGAQAETVLQALEMIATTPHAHNAADYASIVRSNAVRRRIMERAAKCWHAACDTHGDAAVMQTAANAVAAEAALLGNPLARWPQPQPIPDLPAVALFDPDFLPAVFRPWLCDIAERMQCPLDYPAVAAMVCVASAVGRRVAIRPKQRDNWTVVPNLWGAVIGRPGLLKSPAIAEPLRPLQRLEVKAKEAHDAARQFSKAHRLIAEAREKQCRSAIQKAVKNGDDPAAVAQGYLDAGPDAEPVRRRYLCNDSTVEKLGELLQGNPRGLLVHRDELVGLLKSLDRDGQEGARSFYLEAWNGDSRFTYDRIGRGTLDIEACCISVLGGIQPGPLGEYLRAATAGGRGDDGLMQRLQLLVWPDCPPKFRNVDCWPDTEAKNNAYDVFERLNELVPDRIGAVQEADDSLPFLRFSPDAQTLFNNWRIILEDRLRSGELPPALESHLAKYRSLVPSLALLLHLADDLPGPVGTDALSRALRWADYLESHAGRVYGATVRPERDAARTLAGKIRCGKLSDGFALRDVYNCGWSGLATSAEAAAAVGLLCELDVLAEVIEPTRGRSKTSYLINPKFLARSLSRTSKTSKSPAAPPSAAFAGSPIAEIEKSATAQNDAMGAP